MNLRMREARAKPMRDQILNCGYYNELWGLRNIRWALGRAILTFHKDQIA